MKKVSLNILQISAADLGGGAAKVGWDLFQAYKNLGYRSWLAVGKKRSTEPDIIQIPNDDPQSFWEQLSFKAADLCEKKIGKIKGAGLAKNFFLSCGRYKNYVAWLSGREPFDYPGSRQLLNLVPEKPDIIHCHNLHSKYFDLSMLPTLSQKIPFVMTLHDTWLLSGHCAYSIGCDRWKSGCGNCPDLTLYPALRRDGTAANLAYKKSVYSRSRLYVITPSRWLMNKVSQSVLTAAELKTTVIPNGVDLTLFKHGDKLGARQKLGLPPCTKIILFIANSIKTNIWKDYATVRRAAQQLATLLPHEKIMLVCVGDDYPTEQHHNFSIKFVPHRADAGFVVDYYQAADLYFHAAHADTFPTVILEALACGLPVIATAIDGITEQIKSLNVPTKFDAESVIPIKHSSETATGSLVNRGDWQVMAQQAYDLLTNQNLMQILSINATIDAHNRFDQQRQIADYLAWYNFAQDDFLGQPKLNIYTRSTADNAS